MQLIDANVVIRYLLQDNEVLSKEATKLIEQNHDVYVVNEVVAEIIYVLLKVYELPKEKIIQSLQLLFAKDLLKHTQPMLIDTALTIYQNQNMDFVDCLLIAYHQTFDFAIISFDKKLNKHLRTSC